MQVFDQMSQVLDMASRAQDAGYKDKYDGDGRSDDYLQNAKLGSLRTPPVFYNLCNPLSEVE